MSKVIAKECNIKQIRSDAVELAAVIFKISQIDENIKIDDIGNTNDSAVVHNSAGKQVKEAISNIIDAMLEDSSTTDKNVSHLEKVHIKRLKEKAKNGQLMLDE